MTTEREYREAQQRLRRYRRTYKRKSWFSIKVFLGLLIGVSFLVALNPSTVETSLEPVEDTIDQMGGNLNRVKDQIDTNNNRVVELNDQLEQLDSQIDQLNGQIHQLDSQLAPSQETEFAVSYDTKTITTSSNTYQFLKASHYNNLQENRTTWTPENNGVFFVVELEITNNTGNAGHINPENLEVIADQNVRYAYDEAMTNLYVASYNPRLSLPNSVAPGSKKKVALVYNIDRSSKNIELAYFNGDRYYSVPLGHLKL